MGVGIELAPEGVSVSIATPKACWASKPRRSRPTPSPSDGPASGEPARQTALDEIDELSDEMAEALLNAELSGVRGDRGERN